MPCYMSAVVAVFKISFFATLLVCVKVDQKLLELDSLHNPAKKKSYRVELNRGNDI